MSLHEESSDGRLPIPRWLLLSLLVLGALGTLLLSVGPHLFTGGERDASRETGQGPVAVPEGSPRLTGAGSPESPSFVEPTSAGTLDRLLGHLETSDGEALVSAATELRHLLRTNSDALRHALAQLKNTALEAETRARLAFVLGTLNAPGVRAALLVSIDRFGEDVAYLRAALLALGAQQEPAEADDIFAMGDRPHGAMGPGGLGITVRRVIDDPKIRAVLLAHLEHEDAGVRESVARALAASVSHAEVRTGLHRALRLESSDTVAAHLVEPLGAWMARVKAGAERDLVLATLLETATTPGLNEARFRLEKDLGRVPLPKGAWVRLLESTTPSQTPAIRLFALTVLGGAVGQADEATQKRVQARLGALVGSDEDAFIRDLAARQLARLPLAETSVGILERAATRDTAWNVRYTALEGLGKRGQSPALKRVLDHATVDGDKRVSELAHELRSRFYPR